MKSKFIIFMILMSILFITGSFVAFSYPFLKGDVEGTLDVSWANPKGIRFDDLSKGDTMNVHFRCSSGEVGVYLIKQSEADEFRSPAYYKDPLPQPKMISDEGTLDLRIPVDGDWELLFWNDSFTRNKRIDYSIKTDFKRDRNISVISGSSMLFLAMIPVSLLIISRKREGISQMK